MLGMDELVIQESPKRPVDTLQPGVHLSVSEFNQLRDFSEFQKQLDQQENLHQQQLQRQAAELHSLQDSLKNQTEQFKQLCRTNNQFITTIQGLNDDIHRVEEQNVELTRQINQLDTNYRQMRQHNEELCNEMVAKEEEMRKLQNDSIGKSQLVFSEQQVHSLTIELDSLKKDHEVQRKRHLDLKDQFSSLEQDNQELENILEHQKQRYTALQKEQEALHVRQQQQSEEHQQEKMALKENLKQSQKETVDNVIKMQKSKYDLVLRRYQEEINGLKDQVDSLNRDKQALLQEQAQRASGEHEANQVKALQYQLQLKNQLLEKYEDQNQSLKKQVTDKSASRHEMSNKTNYEQSAKNEQRSAYEHRSSYDQSAKYEHRSAYEQRSPKEQRSNYEPNKSAYEPSYDHARSFYEPNKSSYEPRGVETSQEMSYQKYRQLNNDLSKSRSFVKIADEPAYSSPVKLSNGYVPPGHAPTQSLGNQNYSDMIQNFKQRINKIQSSNYNL